jgi:putative oxidoreductase
VVCQVFWEAWEYQHRGCSPSSLPLVEFLGGLALIVGLFTRVVAILLTLDMLVALLTVHLPGGFFTTNGESPLMLLAAAIGLALGGPGEAALDRLLAARTRNPTLARLTT